MKHLDAFQPFLIVSLKNSEEYTVSYFLRSRFVEI